MRRMNRSIIYFMKFLSLEEQTTNFTRVKKKQMKFNDYNIQCYGNKSAISVSIFVFYLINGHKLNECKVSCEYFSHCGCFY